jgi:hypothetical protein
MNGSRDLFSKQIPAVGHNRSHASPHILTTNYGGVAHKQTLPNDPEQNGGEVIRDGIGGDCEGTSGVVHGG